MKRTRSKSLSDLVITKNDLRNVWAFLERTAATDAIFFENNNRLPSGLERPELLRPTIVIASADSLTTETDNEVIFDNDVLDLQKSLSIDFRYSNYRNGRSIRVGLKEGNSIWSHSSFSVSGEDTGWVDAAFADLTRIFGAVRPQSDIFKRFRWLAAVVLATAIGYSVAVVMSLFIPTDTHETIPAWVQYVKFHPPLRYLVKYAADCLIGSLPAWLVINWIGRLWPSIEFDFGPEHLKQRKQLRARLGVVAGLLLLPFALEAFERFVLGWH